MTNEEYIYNPYNWFLKKYSEFLKNFYRLIKKNRKEKKTAQINMKRCSTSQVIMGIQSTILRYFSYLSDGQSKSTVVISHRVKTILQN
jgi:hypothetical protein